MSLIKTTLEALQNIIHIAAQLVHQANAEHHLAHKSQWMAWSLCEDMHGNAVLGFRTGNPRVGFSHTVTVPWHTVPAAGTTRTRPVNHMVYYETRGTFGTRGYFVLYVHKKCKNI